MEMEDYSIVNLYWARSENAISETSKKYGNYCHSIAYNILGNVEDADESVNDTYLDAWNNIPPHRPSILSTFLGKITRRISIDKWRGRIAEKRGGGEIVLVLDELSDCIPSNQSVEHEVEAAELSQLIDNFVMSLSPNILFFNLFGVIRCRNTGIVYGYFPRWPLRCCFFSNRLIADRITCNLNLNLFGLYFCITHAFFLLLRQLFHPQNSARQFLLRLNSLITLTSYEVPLGPLSIRVSSRLCLCAFWNTIE